VCKPLILPKHLTDFEAQQPRHHKVEKNELREFSTRNFDGVLAIVGLENSKSFPIKAIGDKSADKVLVIDNEYFLFHKFFYSQS